MLDAFSADTGAPLWSKMMPVEWVFSSSPTAMNGVVYTAGSGQAGMLYAVRESDGALLWSKDVMNGDESSPALDGQHVFVSYVGPQVYSFATPSGDLAWHHD